MIIAHDPCPICKRPLGAVRVELHHLIPKTFKGKDVIALHGICHRKIHSMWTERELLHHFHTVERILENEDMHKFVAWVSKKPPAFYDQNHDTNTRSRKRR